MAVAQLVELWLVVPAVAGSSPVCHPFKPEVCPIRQKSAFLPVHPDNRRIFPAYRGPGAATGEGRKTACHAGFAVGAAKGGLIVVKAVAGSNPISISQPEAPTEAESLAPETPPVNLKVFCLW